MSKTIETLEASAAIKKLGPPGIQLMAQDLGFEQVKFIVSEMLYALLPEESVAVAMDDLQHEYDRTVSARTPLPICNAATSKSTVSLSEEEIADFMLQRIESGDLALEDIPVRLARYGLMEPSAFVAEMRERMEMMKEEYIAFRSKF
jgi:hypothetical protein